MKRTLLCLFMFFSPLLSFPHPGAAFSSPGSDMETAIAVKVIDGDTVILDDGRHVRYIGINTPETPKPDHKGEPFSAEAAEYNRKLVKGKKVRLEYDRTREDHYGRALAWIWLEDGTLANEEIIGKGYAHCLYDLDNHKYFDRLLQSQRKAMNAGKGIWSAVNREKEKLVGNSRSLRFHEIRCDLAKKVSKKNRKAFDSRWDAFWEGYAPSKKCSTD